MYLLWNPLLAVFALDGMLDDWIFGKVRVRLCDDVEEESKSDEIEHAVKEFAAGELNPQ